MCAGHTGEFGEGRGGVYDRSADIDLDADQESVWALESGSQGRGDITDSTLWTTGRGCPGSGEGGAKGR